MKLNMKPDIITGLVLPIRRFVYGFDANAKSFQAWLALISHVIPREIAAECKESGLFDLDGTIKWGEFWEMIGRQRCHEATNKIGKRHIFRNHNEALDRIFADVDQWA